MIQTRRDFLKASGALIVSFNAASLAPLSLDGQRPFATHPSHIDPNKLDSWLAIAADGTVTAYTGKCDFGQGIFTAQTQLVAEELGVDISQVKLVQCDTDITPDQGTTSGSQSTPTNFNEGSLALAAATAREALLGMAAAKFGDSADNLTATNGVVTSKSGRRTTYAELLAGKHFDLPLNPGVKRKPVTQWSVLGKPVPSLDRAALTTGRFEFVQNVRVDGMLHGRVVRPPEMGATVAVVDEHSLKDVGGFVKVVVRKNFVGVVAETQYQAEKAARQLSVRWNPGPELPAQKDFFSYLKHQPSHDSLSVDSGDVDSQLRSASTLLRASYTYPYQMHGSVGTSCALADVTSDRAIVWSATQSVYPTRSVLAKILNLSLESVRVIFVRGSGCYGLNGADAASFDAAILSQAVGRPVRLRFSRKDEMMWENFGAACAIEQRAGLAPDGHIVAWDREDWVTSLGSRPGYDRPGNVISGMLLGYEPEPLQPGPAKVPKGEFRNRSNTVPSYFAGCVGNVCGGNGSIRSERAMTHTVCSLFFTGPLRSPLRIQNTFANECFLDELSAQAKADPVAFRIHHLRDPRLIAVVKAAAEAAKWDARPSPGPKVGGDRVVSGRGIACVDYEGGNGYAALVAHVEVNLDSGVVHPRNFFLAIDCGPVSNPDGLRNQSEGGILQAVSRALVEEVTWDNRRVTSVDWASYKTLYLGYEMPAVECTFVMPHGVPALGAGETSITVTPAAIGNAIFDATGARLRTIPFTPERVLDGLRHVNQAGVTRSS